MPPRSKANTLDLHHQRRPIRRPTRRSIRRSVRRPIRRQNRSRSKNRRSMTAPLKGLFDLSGRTALVTGGATGLGFEMAMGLAEAGARVAIASRRKELCEAKAAEIAKATGVQTLGLGADVSLLDVNMDRLRHADDVFAGRVVTIASNAFNIEQAARRADLLVGGVLVAGAKGTCWDFEPSSLSR